MEPELVADEGHVLLWRPPEPVLAISSGPLGGGIGERRWVVNATVPLSYDRDDPEVHLREIADRIGLRGAGCGLLTGVDVRLVRHHCDAGVSAWVTTGIGDAPTWAAAEPSGETAQAVGTINAVCLLPVRLVDAALVNAVATVAEAKAQALVESGVPGTGTCTDATVLLCPTRGPVERYGGPRSAVGAPLARAVRAAVVAGLRPPGSSPLFGRR
ncbi:Adenosylcobinamide amidohydrolase [Actinokineospora spheciospongiae]|uniref:Adenosylcobinamide amidohydrolase n=1 Tax=Actinokineospora spheciospongiae TaxID=909613 RepID=W7IRS8_9PSEU|nr:adenosylcobinamide amidohydrolase [Actinokineospora spheciospongiae]EWC59432.1 Adenosylcobinamide amidohydrolase [Actinokineospora spheciospongiae]